MPSCLSQVVHGNPEPRPPNKKKCISFSILTCQYLQINHDSFDFFFYSFSNPETRTYLSLPPSFSIPLHFLRSFFHSFTTRSLSKAPYRCHGRKRGGLLGTRHTNNQRKDYEKKQPWCSTATTTTGERNGREPTRPRLRPELASLAGPPVRCFSRCLVFTLDPE